MTLSTTRRDPEPRRGMLLLLVLSILALFIVVGGVGILLALRAREAARAFAAASASQAASGPLARAQLDEALLRLLRGTNPGGGGVTESLLEDKYGSSQSGTVTAAATGGAVMTVTLAGSFTDTTTGSTTTAAALLGNPAAVAGRVLTFIPAAGDPTDPSSYRILGTDTMANTLLLANVKPATPVPLPTVFPCEVVINGREFSGAPGAGNHESYDAFDDRNPFLTQVALQGSRVASVTRPAFGTAGQLAVDNDGDGVLDGVWLQDALPRRRLPGGGELKFDVSYLVLDLDGRINLNAHGSLVRAQLPRDTTQYPKDPATWPVGMGFGAADVDAALAVGGTGRWSTLLQGGPVTPTATVSTTTQWRPAPRVEATQPGRYTQASTGLAAPGDAALLTGTNTANADNWFRSSPILPRSPTDLKAGLQVFTVGSSPPTLQFGQPSSGIGWQAGSYQFSDYYQQSGANAHPYALRLDADASQGAGGASHDALYTVGELERLLRPFDADAATLAPRLAVMLDDLAERSRMTVTTESWDTPAITNRAVIQAIAAIPAAGVRTVLSPESVAGLRFNLARPLPSAAARQDYFKQLYTLCLAAGAPAPDAAQWAANVIEFRDNDSTMSWYPYDANALSGQWSLGATGVWGMERPELVMTSATATGGSVTVSLYRPWLAQLCTGPTPTVGGTTERIDANLGSETNNTLNAAKAVGTSGVWRLSVTWATGSTSSGLNSVVTLATAMAVNSGTSARILTGGTATQVVLQRLANPALALGGALTTGTGTNAYVDVQRLTIPATGIATPRPVSRWLHWPNRELVSHGELLAVQSGSGNDLAAVMLDGAANAPSEASLARSYPAILDATIVPSRFAAANVTVANGATNLAGTGFENFQYGQFSRWREAGRVNVNTILANTGNTPASLDDAVLTALVGPNSGLNPFTVPVTSDRDLLVVGGDAVYPRSTSDAASAFLKRATAIRLANVATIRSHVFAVWITVRITDVSSGGGSPQFARLFAIVDRSIPVGYAPGRNLNVRETVRLQRVLP